MIQRKILRVAFIATLPPLALTVSNPAYAQSDASNTFSVGNANGQLEDIVVTAQKIEENLQKVPISISTLSSKQLGSRGIMNAADLQGALPGVELQPIDKIFVAIRGVGTFNLQPGVDSSVAYTLDGNYIAHPAQLPPLLFDLERVEALRGPQGTLFGRNANAGALNQVTARPQDTASASAAVGIGNYDLLRSELMVNLPASDKVMFRAAFASEKHDPYLDDGHNNENVIAGRIRALFLPSDTLSIIVTADYNRQKSHNNGVSPCPPNAEDPACIGVKWRPFAGLANPNPDDFSRTRGGGIYAQLDWSLGFGTLTYIPTYRSVHTSSLTTPTLPGYGLDDRNKLFTQELRLASDSASAVKWVAGLYYSRERDRQLIQYFWDAVPNVDGVTSYFTVDRYLSTSKAAFAQMTIPVTSAIRLTGGLRYTDEDKVQRGTANAYGGTMEDPVLLTAPTGGDEAHKKLTFKAGAEADIGAASLLYANVSTGYKSGGINQVDPTLGLPTTYAPEKITAYEIGTKNRFLDGRLQVNAEAYHYDYKGFQTITASFQPSGLLFFLTLNSQKATFTGGELEANFLITPDDRFDLAATFLDAKFNRFLVAGLDYSGNRVPYTPRYTFAPAYQHSFLLPNAAKLDARIETRIVGSHYVTAANEPAARQSAYTQTSANLTYEAANGKWSVIGWIRNIENKGVIYDINPPGTQPESLGYPFPPRTFGLTLKVGT